MFIAYELIFLNIVGTLEVVVVTDIDPFIFTSWFSVFTKDAVCDKLELIALDAVNAKEADVACDAVPNKEPVIEPDKDPVIDPSTFKDPVRL